MRKNSSVSLATLATALLWAATAHSAPPKDPPRKCANDAVLVGSVCVDTYEASVWRIPDPSGANRGLVSKVRKGKATVANLIAGGATQLGTSGDDYAPCLDRGEACKDDIYAVSVAGVAPSAYITWFQSNIACANSSKRLPSNAEWQTAVTGAPDPGGDNGTNDCNTASALAAVATGSRSSCVSAFAAFDMVGNLSEWVADWVPNATACGNWVSSTDWQCLAGASTTGEPGTLLRGGAFNLNNTAGPLTVFAIPPSTSGANDIGFRCAR